MHGNFAGKALFNENPDKIWYPTSPRLFWWALGSINEGNYPDEEWVEDMVQAFQTTPVCYGEMVQGMCEYAEGEPGVSFDDGTEAYDEWSIRFFNEEWEKGICGKTLLSFIEALEFMNRGFLSVQAKSCELNGKNLANYANDSFINRMLFVSDEHELLYVTADKMDENGMKTGEVSLHCMKF